jgi:hypothetical protein
VPNERLDRFDCSFIQAHTTVRAFNTHSLVIDSGFWPCWRYRAGRVGDLAKSVTVQSESGFRRLAPCTLNVSVHALPNLRDRV